LVDVTTMNLSDDSDEDIFDATARPAAGSNSVISLIQCAEDETCCEMLQFPSNDEARSVKTPLESVVPALRQTTDQSTNSDSDCKCDIGNNHPQDTAVPAPSGLVDCESSVDVDSSVASAHCDDSCKTTDNLVRSDCRNSCLTDTCIPEVLGSCETAEPTDSCVSVNSDEPDDELLAELESEFSCTTPVQNDYVSSDYCNANGPLSSQADRLSNDDLTSAYVSLQRRQQALECRLQNTLEVRRQLEAENARLECKLNASLEALEAAKQDMESAKSQV